MLCCSADPMFWVSAHLIAILWLGVPGNIQEAQAEESVQNRGRMLRCLPRDQIGQHIPQRCGDNLQNPIRLMRMIWPQCDSYHPLHDTSGQQEIKSYPCNDCTASQDWQCVQHGLMCPAS